MDGAGNERPRDERRSASSWKEIKCEVVGCGLMDLVWGSSESSTSISVELVKTHHIDKTESDPHQNQPHLHCLYRRAGEPHPITAPNQIRAKMVSSAPQPDGASGGEILVDCGGFVAASVSLLNEWREETGDVHFLFTTNGFCRFIGGGRPRREVVLVLVCARIAASVIDSLV